jgi:hypothetical protein
MNRRQWLKTAAAAGAVGNLPQLPAQARCTIESRVVRWKLRHTWTTVMSSSQFRDNLYVKFTAEGVTGHGEGAPIVRYHENAESARKAIAAMRPFLANVLRGRPVPPERIEEVVEHYAVIGGRSPLNELTQRQADALAAQLARDGLALPVYVGMRNWHPLLRETFAAMQRDGMRNVLGIILAAQHSDASWGRYHRDIADARAALNDAAKT